MPLEPQYKELIKVRDFIVYSMTTVNIILLYIGQLFPYSAYVILLQLQSGILLLKSSSPPFLYYAYFLTPCSLTGYTRRSEEHRW